jgi:cytochrome c oxidase subunit II
MPPPVRRKLLVSTWTLSVLALVLAGSAVAGNGGIAPSARSPNAERIRDLHWLLLAITGVIFVLVEGALLLFVFRFRSRGRNREVEGPQIRGHQRLELIWTAIPVLILASIIAVVFYKLPGIQDVPAAGAAGPKMTVKVEGRQFYWRYVYPNGAVSVNELRVPAERPIELEVTAPANDVAHSWWVPALAGKIDAIPGKTNHTWFLAERPGTYKGQCAEFCGIQHALMVASVQALPESEYETWVAGRLKAGSDLGRQTFEGACGPCHGLTGKGLIGPPLQGNATLANRERLFQLLRNGKNAMPPVGRGWDQRQLDALAAYVQKEFAGGG